VCVAGWALGRPFQYRRCPTPSNGTVKIDVPTLATEKEFAPDGVVVGEDVPCTRDALTGDHGRKIEETKEIDSDLLRETGQEIWMSKVSEITRGENGWMRGPINCRGDCVESYPST
jgi:hypothetical protein